ncbi:MAG: hypothetical protein WCS70_00335 [Verrucomicrobiota bacterium]
MGNCGCPHRYPVSVPGGKYAKEERLVAMLCQRSVENRCGTPFRAEGIAPGVGKRLDGTVRKDKMLVNETARSAMVADRRSYGKCQFKRSALQHWRDSGKSVAQIARELGVNLSTLTSLSKHTACHTHSLITKPEHICRQLLYVESVALTVREIGLHFGYLVGKRDPHHAEAHRTAVEFFKQLGQPIG